MIGNPKPPIELRLGYKDKIRVMKIHNLPCVNCKLHGRRQTSKTICHHKIGSGLGKKASDLLTMALCENCHTKLPTAIHNIPLAKWEEENLTQDELIRMTNELLKM